MENVQETKVAKNLRQTGLASRTDAYYMNPLDIKVDFESNPRKDYNEEDFSELKANIKENGIQVPISVYVDKSDGSVNLAHGFRRMKATLELISEGVNIEKVLVTTVTHNEEDILLNHLTLNSGLKLTDLETAYTLNKLSNMMGGNIAEIARRTGMKYNKVVNLINFHKESSHYTKELVEDKKISMTVAQQLAKQVAGTERQNKILEKAIKRMEEDGRSKIAPADLPDVKLQHRTNHLNLFKETVTKLAMEEVESVSVSDLFTMIKAMENGESSSDALFELIAKVTS